MKSIKNLSTNMLIIIAILAILFLVPLTKDRFLMTTIFTISIFVTLAEAYNILGGYTGYVNFGYAAFYGLGAYVTGIIARSLNISPLYAIPIATLIVAIASALMSVPLLRIKGVYFAIAMITVNYIFYCLVILFPEVTGAGVGLVLPPPPPLELFYYLGLIIMLGTILFVYKLSNSKFGLAFKSIREDEDAAEISGVNTTVYKVLAFTFSVIPAAITGGIIASYWSYIDPPTMFDIGMSVKIILMVRLGGPGTIIGPIMGTVVVQLISYALRYTLAGVLHKVIWGALLAAVVVFLPNGLVEFIKRAEWIPEEFKRIIA
ncbi:MAG: hypothetical protein DRJ21_02265 [Candidatus Methanomethylicota archaeon]|uniref:Branched-chain amino acid ABC transporter permease n=1 Tax=Thermoproteota archaeon TaxID=2056631 RepID=A0A497ERE3_9CREN|nr:MAG: hypothetical protein DRJ21_02265 [Candidatus Verstraetearchaeota archaeon]